MSGPNSFGSRFVVTTFGESHGQALGCVIDGVPSGIAWSESLLLSELARRRPGQSQFVSARNEEDSPQVLSGVFEGKTLGTPIAIIVRNGDVRSQDYAEIAKQPRRGHADDVWKLKFGHSDTRGGGRSSGRETVARVMGGAVAQMLIKQSLPDFKLKAFAKQIGPIALTPSDVENLLQSQDDHVADLFAARFPSRSKEEAVKELLVSAKAEGKSYGGVAELWIEGLPQGLGQPVFRKLKAELAAAYMGVGATAAVEIGDGLSAANEEGSQFHRQTGSAHYGGLRGGLTTGEKVVARITFKPTSSVLETAKKGRHDPCIVPRAIPVLEAMTYLVIADHLLWMRTDKL